MSLLSPLRALFQRRRIDDEVDEELRFHIEMETRANLDRGLPPAEARRVAVRDLGVTQTKEAVRDLRRLWPEAVLQDVAYAARRLVREPGFAATAILILAVGIGACAAMFSIVHAVLLRPIGVQDPDRLVMIWTRDVRHEGVGELPYRAHERLRAGMRSFDDVAILGSVNWWGTLIIDGGEPIGMSCNAVSASFFDVLGARPLLGRTFRPEDDAPAAPRVLVLSHAIWTQHFGEDPEVIGRRVMVREEAPAEPFEIIGVMPPEFFFPRGAQYWTPAGPRLARIAQHQGGSHEFLFDALNVFYGIARLTPGATLRMARAETAAFLGTVSKDRDVDLTHTQMVLTPVLDHIFGQARPALLVLMGAVVIVLLVACVNVAGLSFARGAARVREMALRAALGASRAVLVRQLMAESALVAFGGTIVGLLAAALVLDTLVALSPADIPRLDATALDGRVLVFAITAAAAATLVVGLVPALRLSRPSLVEDIKGAASGAAQRSTSPGTRRMLITVQTGATLVLLVAAGLMVQSFARLARLDLGFNPRHVLTFNISGLDDTRYPARSQRHDAVEDLLARFDRLPHVTAAGAVLQRPFEHGPIGLDSDVLLEGQVDSRESRARNPMLNYESVAGDYFGAMGIRLLRGRPFDDRDTGQAPPVVIVSEAMAARLWPGEDPIGQRLRTLRDDDQNQHFWQTVVGVVATARYREIETPRFDLYVPHRRAESDVQHFTLRTTIDPLQVAPQISAEITAFDTALSIGGVTSMEEVVRRTRGPWHFNMIVFSLFGAVALALAAVGLFGLVAYEVAQRSREIGVRMALGAQRGDVVRLMVMQGARPAGVGLLSGIGASILVTRVLSELLFEISPTDPATLTGVACLLGAVTVLASYVPARRAASVDPQVVLREG
jgi:putative ABC transport system permease protein